MSRGNVDSADRKEKTYSSAVTDCILAVEGKSNKRMRTLQKESKDKEQAEE